LDCEIIVNLQGDEPLIDCRAVSQAVDALRLNPQLNVATLGFPLKREKVWKDPNIVKILTDENNDALYFSRQPIPYFRDLPFSPTPGLFQHLGVYIYRKNFLVEFLNWSPSPLEKAEKLEQLRILSKGFKIKIIPTTAPSFGVDTPDDVSRVEEMLKKGMRID
jgi:3-deoxy-manno-octulosonate cytidylyltransferase (CMP-KDO synthetase)